ncbi:MAG TPA: HD domain-containing phosphohydrolase [bacterium]|nr:HD domain-containing phosphohydrolase [bacterium]
MAPSPEPLRATRIIGDPIRHLSLAVGAAIGLYSGALLWDAHQGWNALAAVLAGGVGGLGLEYEGSPLVPYAGYVFGLLSITLAASATGLGVLAYGPWIALGGALFPTWPAFAGLAAVDVLSVGFALTEGRSPSPLTLLAPAAAVICLHLGAVLVSREVRARSHLALTDPLTGLANRRLLGWRLGEELSHARRTGGTFALMYLDLQGFREVNTRHGHRAGDRALVQVAQILRDTMRAHDVIARTSGDEFAILAPGLGEPEAVVVVERIRAAISRATTLPLPLRLAAGWAIAPRDGMEAGDLLETAASSVFEQKLASRSAGPSLPTELMTALWSLPEGAQQLVRLLHTEGIELEEHLSHVGQWSMDLGRMVGLDPARQTALAQAVLVHDVGKLVVPVALLRKPGPLTRDEEAIVAGHVTSGAALLRATGVDEAVVSIVAAHHERWDGGGYPAGLAADQIPLEARILAIADGYDTMVARRPYRKAWTTTAAIADVQLEGGHQFDPELVTLIIPVISASG